MHLASSALHRIEAALQICCQHLVSAQLVMELGMAGRLISLNFGLQEGDPTRRKYI
jgi:hypothetical protein